MKLGGVAVILILEEENSAVVFGDNAIEEHGWYTQLRGRVQFLSIFKVEMEDISILRIKQKLDAIKFNVKKLSTGTNEGNIKETLKLFANDLESYIELLPSYSNSIRSDLLASIKSDLLAICKELKDIPSKSSDTLKLSDMSYWMERLFMMIDVVLDNIKKINKVAANKVASNNVEAEEKSNEQQKLLNEILSMDWKGFIEKLNSVPTQAGTDLFRLIYLIKRDYFEITKTFWGSIDTVSLKKSDDLYGLSEAIADINQLYEDEDIKRIHEQLNELISKINNTIKPRRNRSTPIITPSVSRNKKMSTIARRARGVTFHNSTKPNSNVKKPNNKPNWDAIQSRTSSQSLHSKLTPDDPRLPKSPVSMPTATSIKSEHDAKIAKQKANNLLSHIYNNSDPQNGGTRRRHRRSRKTRCR